MRRMLCALLCMCVLLVSVYADEQEQPQDIEIDREAVLALLYEADIATIREAISTGLVTCEQMTAYYLERITDYNEPYNCFITVCEDALEKARERDRQMAAGEAKGILFGVPIVVKDNIDVAGYHMTNGYIKLPSNMATTNAVVVESLLAQGAVIIGKTNMSWEATSAITSISTEVGETMNAYSVYMAAGGSSGGSAVAVSLNFAAAGIGTDTNSSLRIPAALAGCISLRPTHDLISRTGVDNVNYTRDTAGAITRGVYDQAILMDAMTDMKYNFTGNLNGDRLEGLRIGVLKELSYEVTGWRTKKYMDSEVQAAFAQALEELKACGAEVVEVSMPSVFTKSDATFDSLDPVYKDNLHNYICQTLEQYDVSALIFPSYLNTPIRSGNDENGVYWNPRSQPFINNCRVLSPSACAPEITVPIGLHSLGAGIGMEIIAPRYSEQLLLDIAYSYTSRYDHRVLPEGAPNTYADAYLGSLQTLRDSCAIAESWLSAELPGLQVPEVSHDAQSLFVPLPEKEPAPEPEPTVLKSILPYWPVAAVTVLTAALICVLLKILKNCKNTRTA